jgi:hypothetical protein
MFRNFNFNAPITFQGNEPFWNQRNNIPYMSVEEFLSIILPITDPSILLDFFKEAYSNKRFDLIIAMINQKQTEISTSTLFNTTVYNILVSLIKENSNRNLILFFLNQLGKLSRITPHQDREILKLLLPLQDIEYINTFLTTIYQYRFVYYETNDKVQIFKTIRNFLSTRQNRVLLDDAFMRPACRDYITHSILIKELAQSTGIDITPSTTIQSVCQKLKAKQDYLIWLQNLENQDEEPNEY